VLGLAAVPQLTGVRDANLEAGFHATSSTRTSGVSRGFSRTSSRPHPPDRDTLLRDFAGEWGSDLVIPFAFSTVETILPRAVSNRPRMLILPVDEDAEKSVENMRYLIDQQQQKCGYEMKLEETAKSGFIYGLGVQKLFWKTTYTKRPSLTQKLMADPQTGQVKPMWIEGPERAGAGLRRLDGREHRPRRLLLGPVRLGHGIGRLGDPPHLARPQVRPGEDPTGRVAHRRRTGGLSRMT
jgi:hypothetical protein